MFYMDLVYGYSLYYVYLLLFISVEHNNYELEQEHKKMGKYFGPLLIDSLFRKLREHLVIKFEQNRGINSKKAI